MSNEPKPLPPGAGERAAITPDKMAELRNLISQLDLPLKVDEDGNLCDSDGCYISIKNAAFLSNQVPDLLRAITERDRVIAEQAARIEELFVLAERIAAGGMSFPKYERELAAAAIAKNKGENT